MKMNYTWHLINSDNNITCISTFKSKGNCEQVPIYWIVICVLNALLSFTALFGNSAIFITIWKTSSLRSVANILLASLAVSDLAVGLVVQPLFIAYLLSEIFIVQLLFNILSSFLCWASFVTITTITVDRLLAIQLHLRYHALVTPFRVTWVVISIWLFSGVSRFLSTKIGDFVLIISGLVLNFAVYLKIYFIVRRHQRQIQHQLQQQPQLNNGNIFRVTRLKKTAFNTFLVYILLLCYYLPYCVSLVKVGGGISRSVYKTTSSLIFPNSSLNPLLYCWRDREIRAAMKQTFWACG